MVGAALRGGRSVADARENEAAARAAAARAHAAVAAARLSAEPSPLSWWLPLPSRSRALDDALAEAAHADAALAVASQAVVSASASARERRRGSLSSPPPLPPRSRCCCSRRPRALPRVSLALAALLHLLLPLLTPRPAPRAALKRAPSTPPLPAPTLTPNATTPTPRDLWRLARGSANASAEGAYLWCPVAGALDAWWLLPLLVRATLGVWLVPFGSDSATAAPFPDALLLGMYAPHHTYVADAAARSRFDSLIVFIASEVKTKEEFDAGGTNGLVVHADLSLAGARTLSHLWRYAVWPIFMHSIVDRAAATAAANAAATSGDGTAPTALCPLNPVLTATRAAADDAAAWAARPGFTLFLSFHAPYPRDALHRILHRTLSPPETHSVDHPGRMGQYRTSEWPSDIPDTAEGKVMLLQRYRFSICAENANAKGYVTEKLVDVLLGGAVPIYWGDIESFPEVFNPARVLRFVDTEPSGATLLRTIVALEEDAAARAAFFAQPILAPTAQAWTHATCAVAAMRLSASLAHFVRTKTDPHAPAGGGGGEGDDCEMRERDAWPLMPPRV